MADAREVIVRPARAVDAEAIVAIYNHYIANTVVTFEEQPVTAPRMAQRLDEAAPLPWLVAESDGEVVGYACASKWKGRCAYRYSVESSVYLDPAAVGRGIGSMLYAALIDALHAQRLHTIISGIALPNDASIRLHEKFGFRKIGHFEQVGYKFGRWIDVAYFQLSID